MNLFRGLTILHLTPDYILISFTISRIINIVIETKEYVILTLFPLQFVTLLFYLEILEFNFCGLNRNTKKNISEREEKEKRRKEDFYSISDDYSDIDGNSNYTHKIEISPDYLVFSNTTKSINDVDDENNDNDEFSKAIN